MHHIFINIFLMSLSPIFHGVPMRTILITVITMPYYGLAGLLSYLAYSYEVNNYGLHPGMALPLVFVCLIIAITFPMFMADVHRTDDLYESSDHV